VLSIYTLIIEYSSNVLYMYLLHAVYIFYTTVVIINILLK